MKSSDNKQLAVQFLELIVAGKIDEAYEKYVDMSGRHHNIFTPAGLPALQKGMKENDAKFPHKSLIVKNVIGDADFVAVHSRLVLDPGKMDLVAVHILRFRDGKIVEIWDCVQPIPADLPNKDGAF